MEVAPPPTDISAPAARYDDALLRRCTSGSSIRLIMRLAAPLKSVDFQTGDKTRVIHLCSCRVVCMRAELASLQHLQG